ncbi:Hsp20/alpha crystallin family protein [Streptomyces sp. NPDC059455]|uniref:Hsp20/alpha crystallin family protein n=1 Tax=Streptomyces sp. NPDC059455 TaxID=3346837 RepID=UPI0036B5407D
MAVPVHRRPGRLLERPFHTLGWGEPVAAEYDDLFERMNRFFEAATSTAPAAMPFSPLADLHETDEAHVVEAELPGIKREDIHVAIGERELCVSGAYKEREREGVLRHGTRVPDASSTGLCCRSTSRPTRSQQHWPTEC